MPHTIFPASPGSGAPVYAPAYLQPWNASTTTGYTRTLQGAATFSGTIAGAVLTVVSITTGQLWPGQTIAGTGVTASTILGTQITGTANGAGTYNLSLSSTVATAEAMTSVAVPVSGTTLHNWYDSGAFTIWGGAKAGSSGTSAGYAYNPSEPSASDIYVPQLIEWTMTLAAGGSFTVAQQLPTASAYAATKLFINGTMQTQYGEVTANGSALANDIYLTTYTIPNAGSYTFTLWMDWGFKGIYSTVAPTASLRVRNGKRLVICADSWYNGGNAGIGGATIVGSIVDNNCLETALQTGHDEVIVLAEPGTGWVCDGTNVSTIGVMTNARTPFNATRRMQAIIEHNPSTVIAIGSVNDIPVATYNTITNTRVTQWINYVVPQLSPYTTVFIGGGQYQNLYGKASFTPIDTQITLGITNSSYASRIKQIVCTSDNTTTGTPWLTGTGNTSAPAGDGGNSDIYLNSDRKHLNRVGQYAWSTWLAGRMISLGV